MNIKLDQYMEERLIKLNYELHPVEGNDVTLLIGTLIAKHEKLKELKKLVETI